MFPHAPQLSPTSPPLHSTAPAVARLDHLGELPTSSPVRMLTPGTLRRHSYDSCTLAYAYHRAPLTCCRL